ncbi:MAG: hypothetical protein IKW01_01835 [Firmicutes bacterium]|nr:hypothetical protein [Bacillota bacterium]
MNCLSEIYSLNGLLQKIDGVIVNKSAIFCIEDNAEPEILRMYADLSSRIGLEITGMKLPITGKTASGAVKIQLNQGAQEDEFILEICEGGLLVSAKTTPMLRRAVEYLVCKYPYFGNDQCFDIQKEALGGKDITEAVFNGETLDVKKLKTDGEWREPAAGAKAAAERETAFDAYGNITGKMQMKDSFRICWNHLWAKSPEALMTVAVRTAMDGFKAVYPLVTDELSGEEKGITIKESSSLTITFHEGNLCFEGTSETMGTLTENYALNLQFLNDIKTDGWIKDMEATLSGKNEVGQAIKCLSEESHCDKLITKGYSKALVDRGLLTEYLGKKNIGMANHIDPVAVKEWSFADTAEAADFMEEFRKNAVPAIEKGKTVSVYGLLSEDKDVRDDLSEQLRNMIIEKGAEPGEIQIIRSFKSGYSWIEEFMIPEIKALEVPVHKIKIGFKYFMNERGDDAFEDESIPNYGKHMDNPEKWFDIPIRWLQELFPIDEVIAAELDIATDDVEFVRMDDTQYTYKLQCFDKEDRNIFEKTFETSYNEKHYIERYPVIGKTHVSTGKIKVLSEDKVILEKRIETDAEKAFSFMEKVVLPDLETYFVDKYGKDKLPEMQPLFNRLQLDLSFSEMDFDTGIRQERISMAESMQEDIYFYILDWFKTYGERECNGIPLDNIGLVYPNIKNRKNSPVELKVTLYDDLFDGAAVCRGNEKLRLEAEPEAKITIKEIAFEEGLHIKAQIEGGDYSDRLEALTGLISKKAVSYPVPVPVKVTFETADKRVSINLPEYRRKKSDMTEEERMETLRTKVVDYPTYERLLDCYAEDPRLKVIPVGTSYLGRKLYAVELVKKTPGIIYSRYKMQNSRITALFNARHHGNEATSLNDAFLLMDHLLSEEVYSEKMNKVNVLFVPYENADGGEMHCEIHKDNPKWLAHVARYNAAGFEFRKDFGNKDTKYGEAKIVRELWEKWLPDIVTDNHGFEGHELVQPFSGYISPWYKSFWIPRALYYGYIWYDSTIPHLEAYGAAVRDTVAEAINRDEEIYELNKVCAERFFKYAQKWFPTLFTSTKFNDVIFYWMDTAIHKRANNFAVSNPEITVIDWTTEVADETVTGEDYYMNVRAHLISDMALMDVIDNTPVRYDSYPDESGYIKIRRKPLIL